MRVLLYFTAETRRYYPIVKEVVEDKFGFLDPSEAKTLELKEDWFNEAMDKYNANKMLNDFERGADELFLLVISEGLYVPGLEHVFGRAVPYAGAVVSTGKLEENRKKLENRLRKEAIQKMGLVLDLDYCNSQNCVMRAFYPRKVEQIDNNSEEFCISCKKKLKSFKESIGFKIDFENQNG